MDSSPQGFTGTSQFSLQVSKDLSASQSFSYVPPLEIKFSSSFLLCERNQPISHFPWHNPISSLLLLSSCQVFPTSSSCVLLSFVSHAQNAPLEPDNFLWTDGLVIYRLGMETWECYGSSKSHNKLVRQRCISPDFQFLSIELWNI